jgi:hypothetical protein
MEPFKIENFEKENGPGTFPAFRHLGSDECEKVRQGLCEALGMADSSTGLDLVLAIQSKGSHIREADANSDGFDLGALVKRIGLPLTEKVYLNWYRIDDIDEFATANLFQYFDDIRYPASDDLDVIAPDLGWILSVSHEGDVAVLRT